MEPSQCVLLLNSSFEPLTVLPVKRAFKLLFSHKAHTIEQSGESLATVRARITVPSVIQIAYYVRKPYTRPRFSKKAIFIRDGFRCQYCGKYHNKPTIDHIIPRSKGGTNDWLNVVTACHTCNNKKGDRTLKESKLKLIREPFEPKFIVYSSVNHPKYMERWEKYFNPVKRQKPDRTTDLLDAVAYGEPA